MADALSLASYLELLVAEKDSWAPNDSGESVQVIHQGCERPMPVSGRLSLKLFEQTAFNIEAWTGKLFALRAD